MPTDLLLINASNFPPRPIYPYAFVQVSAVARRFGLSVERHDLFGLRRELWAPVLRRLVERHRPRAIGLHLRQGDSLLQVDYRERASGRAIGTYFPVDDTRELVHLLRTLANAPIVVGGFGFTTHARRLYERLEVDYGVAGDPDGFFERFEDVVAGRALSEVPGLLYREAGQVRTNARGYYLPASEREYDDGIVDELVRFYGQEHLFGADPPAVAVEVMRGCPFRCYFCSEPYVKGRRFERRSLDTIVGELDFLLSKDLRRFWLVCSELNIDGTDFAFALAAEIRRLAISHPGPPIEWLGYSLPTLKEPELRTLQAAGYVGAVNDVLSLDDANLRRAGVPYRSRHALAFLDGSVKLAAEKAAAQGANPPKPLRTMFSLFLGNAHVDENTIARTLETVDERRLQEHFTQGYVIGSTRIFELDGTPNCSPSSNDRSYDRSGERPIDLAWPTFHYAPFLMDTLGTPEAIEAFFTFLSNTFLSTAHRSEKDWCAFLVRHAGEARVAEWITGLRKGGDRAGLSKSAAQLLDRVLCADTPLHVLLAPPSDERKNAGEVALWLLERVFAGAIDVCQRVSDHFGIPTREDGRVAVSEYRLMRILYERTDNVSALREELQETFGCRPGDLPELYLSFVLYANNVILGSRYRALLVPRGPQQTGRTEEN